MIKIKPWCYDDKILGKRIKFEITPYYFKLSVNNREYYFNKDSGEFDGSAVPINQG